MGSSSVTITAAPTLEAHQTSSALDVVRGAGPVIGSTITYLIPIVSVLLGVLVLGEALGLFEVIGFVIVLAAAAVINAPSRSSATPATGPSAR